VGEEQNELGKARSGGAARREERRALRIRGCGLAWAKHRMTND
jgi:hypothetical protein